MLDAMLLKLIMFCHFVIVCFVIGIPFVGNNYFLVMHLICVPFMMTHWYMNDNTCVLSLIEMELRKKLNMPVNKNDCFTCQLIDPVYEFNAHRDEWSELIYIVTTGFWLITVYKLYCMYDRGEINTMHDLLMKDNTTKLF